MPTLPTQAAAPEQDEKVLHVLELLTSNPTITQRTLAEKTGVSLGLINIIMKRLVETGSIKITQLTGRKVRYFLTPQGIAEKAQRTYTYFSRTIQIFLRQQNRCQSVIHQQMAAGYKNFAILGINEIASLVELALKNSGPDIAYRRIASIQEAHKKEMVLDCRFSGHPKESLGAAVLSKILRQGETVDTPVNSISLAETILCPIHTFDGGDDPSHDR